MQDLGFGTMERSQAGPAKYNGGQLPAVPYIHRAEEVLVGLATARAARDKAYAFAIVDGYIRSKKARGQVPGYIGQKMELLEARIPMNFASVFIDARDWHRLPPSRIIRRRRAPSDAGPSRASTVTSAPAHRPQRPVSAIAGTAGGPGGPSVAQMAAADRRPAVNRPPARGQSQDDDAPPPPYSAEDPEPEATRALQESLAAAAAEQQGQPGGGGDFAPEPSHRRANSTTASMVTAQTSLSAGATAGSRRTSGDRPRPSDFPGSPAARAGSVSASASAATATPNGPSAVSSPAAAPAPATVPVPAADAPPVDTSNMNEEERRAVEESQLEEAMRASRQAEKERREYEAAVAASLAQAEEDALRRALAYPGEALAEGSRESRGSRRGSDAEREPRSGRSSKRSSLHAPSVSSVSSGATVRRTGSFNTNKPLPNPGALPPVQEPANESLMDMLASIDFNAPEIKPITPAPPLAHQRTGGSRGSFSGASGASIEATVASPQSSSNGSWLSGTATATNSAAPSLGTTPTQPTYIHHANPEREPRLKSKNPFLSAEDDDTPSVTVTAGPPPPAPPAPPTRPTRDPPPPPRSDTDDTARPEYADYTHAHAHAHGQYLDPSSAAAAEYDAGSASGGSSPQYSPNWRGDAPGLTINTSPRSGTAPSLSSAGATVAHLTPSTGSQSPSGFPFPVALPTGVPSPRPTSDVSPSPARNLPPIPATRSAESLPPPQAHAQAPPLPPLPPRLQQSLAPPSDVQSAAQTNTQAQEQSHAAAAAALQLLRGYDTVCLVDDSVAGEHWEAGAHLLAALVERAPDGLDVCFLNSKRIGKALREAADVEELFAGLGPRDGRAMGERLDRVLTEYGDRLEREGAGAGAGVRKLNLVVVTDGGFAKPVLARARYARGIADLRHELLSSAGADDAEAVLVAAGKRLDRGAWPPDQVGVQFVQLGEDQEARKALQELDTLPSVHSVRDMVDTVRYRPDGAPLGPELAAKILLGGIHRGVDAMA